MEEKKKRRGDLDSDRSVPSYGKENTRIERADFALSKGERRDEREGGEEGKEQRVMACGEFKTG